MNYHPAFGVAGFLLLLGGSMQAQSFLPTYDLRLAPGSASNAPNVIAYGGESANGIGTTVRAADLNGDGIDDLVVCSYWANVGQPTRIGAGAVYVWWGKSAFGGIKDVAGAVGTVPDLTIWGASDDDSLTRGSAVAIADVNGDGTVDLILGANSASGPNEGRFRCGEAYIILGRKSPATFPPLLDLALQGSDGADVTIYGGAIDEGVTAEGALAAGDINGDGAADVILGSYVAAGLGAGRGQAGRAYVIFGRSSPAGFPPTIDLALPGANEADVTISGASAWDSLTFRGTLSVADVNGDGVGDLLLGASGGGGPAEARSSAGEAYIVFGRATFPRTLDMAVQGNSGANVTLYGANAFDELTAGGLRTGDVNGDGVADLLLGALRADGPGNARADSGEVYIVFGRKNPATFPLTLDMALAGNTGADVTIYAGRAGDFLTSVSTVGGPAMTAADVNGDGVEDLLLGAAAADGPADARNSAGEAYIIYGRTSPAVFPATLDLALQGANGADVTIYGATSGDRLTGNGALKTADVNGDGVPDLLIGAAYASGPGEARPTAGEAYIIFGRKSPAQFPLTLDLGLQGTNGADVTVYGDAQDSLTVDNELAAGDVNGDGTADLIVAADMANGPMEARLAGGEAYVIFGIPSSAPPRISITFAADHAVLTWPTDAAAFTLQGATDLTSSNWVNIATETNQALIPITNAMHFFRLTKP